MNSKAFSTIFPFIFLCFVLVIITDCFMVEAYRHSGTTQGDSCKPSGKVRCNDGKYYYTYKCSPPVSSHTKATLTINSFEEGGDGGGPSECDGKYHSDNDPLVALSTGWFNNKKRCNKYVNVHGNGKSVKAKVVDECDSTRGCAPCHNNIVDASKAVWKALGVPESNWGEMDVYWSD